MKANELQAHIFKTYITLRYGTAVLALTFPVLLYLLGLFQGIPLQDSMSHYYFATPCDFLEKSCARSGIVLFPTKEWVEPVFPMRIWFVGLLFAIGAFLFLYSGFSKKEDWALNLAGIFAWGVALFPMNKDPSGSFLQNINIHGVSAVALFVCMIYVVLLCARDTLYLLPNKRIRVQYRNKYKLIGVFMGIFPIIALVLTLIYRDYDKYTFFAEALGVWTFALYWWVKSRELSQSGADMKALQLKLKNLKKLKRK